MTLHLWDQLQLDRYWSEKLPPSRKEAGNADFLDF
jgi:hypothetical protein